MTDKEKAKAYDEALERAKQIRNGNPSSGTAIVVCEQIFPDLKESEDERIRKRIVLCLEECVHSDVIRDYERDECLAYLEKQKEQNVKKFPFLLGDAVPYDEGYNKGYEDALKEQKNFRKLYEDIAKSEWFKKAYEGKSLR